MAAKSETQQNVAQYYGQELRGSSDLKTNACCTGAAPPPRVREALKNVHPEVVARYYGCGLVFPDELEGRSVLVGAVCCTLVNDNT